MLSEANNDVIRLGELIPPCGDKNKQGYRVYSVYGTSISVNCIGGGIGANTGLYVVKENERSK